MELLRERFVVTVSKNRGKMDNLYLTESELNINKRMD
jgi:hypothetical protein